MGYVLSLIIDNTLLTTLKEARPQAYYTTLILCVILCGIIGYYMLNTIIIFATSFCGAYAFIRGVSMFAGGFPNEGYMFDLINKKEFATLKSIGFTHMLMYFFGFVACFIFSVWFQYKIQPKVFDKEALTKPIKEGFEEGKSKIQNLVTSAEKEGLTKPIKEGVEEGKSKMQSFVTSAENKVQDIVEAIKK